MAQSFRGDPVVVPPRYPTSLIFLDESGSRATASRFFVIGAVKLREPGVLAREIRDVRDRHNFRREFKFSEITLGALAVYYDLIDRLHESDAHLAACVVNGQIHNPFKGKPAWEAHADVTTQLLVGCINRRELVGVLMDGIATPRGCSLEDAVRKKVNNRLRATSVITAACLDSRTNDILQVADVFAGAVLFERRRQAGLGGKPSTSKAKVAARLGALLEHPGFSDGRSDRVNVATYRRPSAGSTGASMPTLHVVEREQTGINALSRRKGRPASSAG
jgi:hypothetical protein